MATLFEAYVTNAGKYSEGQLVGETLKFPTTAQEVEALLKRIGVDGVRYQEIFITSFDGDVLGLYDHLSEYENLDELNHLACLLSELTSSELETLEAVLDSGDHCSSVRDIINLTQNLDCYGFYPGVSDEETLGRIYVDDLEMLDVPDQVKPYFDYEAYGRDACIHENGHFAPGGYVVKESDHFVEVYHGLQDIPKEHKVFSFPKLSIREQMAAYQEIIDGSSLEGYGQWIGEKPPSAKQRVRLAVLAALEKKPTDFADFLHLMEESGFAVKQGRGGVISFFAPEQEKPTRLRASTLGAGFDPEDIKAVIAGERPLPELPEEPTVPPRRVNLIIDIQERMAQGKGPAYERWAKVYNLKQMAAALQYLQEHHLTDYAALTARTEAAVDHFHKLSDELRTAEEALSKTSELMAATVDYAKTRPVFDGYKAARYSKKYLAQHEVELATYRAAKDTMNTILNGAKLPKIEALKKSRRELAGQKKRFTRICP